MSDQTEPMAAQPTFATVHYGRERWVGPGVLARHRHAQGYAALVLAGGYTEAGDGLRQYLAPGTIVFHAPFEAHRNEFGRSGAEILNLPLSEEWSLWGSGCVADPDAVVRAAGRDLSEALYLAATGFCPLPPAIGDWPDRLAQDLRSGAAFELRAWARQHGLAAETVSRGFRLVFGVTPSRYRAEVRARAAWQSITSSPRALADIAAELGFADQAHMTRAVAELTGRPPARWRQTRSIGFKTAGHGSR